MKNKVIFFLLFLSSLMTFGQSTQVNVTINLVPPYSTRLSDYANNPGKVLITLRNTQPRAITVYLRANITGENGIQVFTNPNFKPARGITLQPNVPFILTVADLQDVFDVNQLSTRGTSIYEIERKNGLPEGVYQVCVRAYDFARPTIPVSSESPLGCTSVRLTRLEPPILIKPFDTEEVASFQPQNIIFSWTFPAGAPPGTEYKLKIVEIFDPKRNPNDAFLSSTQPPFFEKTVTGNVYVFGPADPQLVDGRKYAWAVTALDQFKDNNGRNASQGTSFRNGGRSEVRSFTYKQKAATKVDFKEPLVVNKKKPTPQDFKFDPEMNLKNLMTSVSGRLLYAYPEEYKMEPYTANVQKMSASNFSSKFQIRPGSFGQQFYSTGSYLTPKAGAKPMKKVKVNLVMVYAYKGPEQNLSGVVPLFDAGGGWKILTSMGQTGLINYTVNNKNIENESLSKVIATGFTNDNGEFNLGFLLKDTASIVSFKMSEPDKEYYMPYYNSPTGEDTTVVTKGATLVNKLLKKTCILVVESPYYCSPFMMVDPKPQDNIILPDMVGLVKSFELNLKAINNDKANQMGGVAGSLAGVNVELFRKKPMDISLPGEEGQNHPESSVGILNMGSFSQIYPASKVARVVAIDKTNGNGVAVVPRVIRIGSKKNDVFIAHTYTDKTQGTYNKSDGVSQIDAYSSAGIYSNGFDGDFDENLEFNEAYKYAKEFVNVVMASKKPAIKGKIVEKNIALKGVDVVLLMKNKEKEEQSSPSVWSSGYVESLVNGFEKFQEKYGYKVVGSQVSTADGYFEFSDLEPGDYQVLFKKSGYKENPYPGGNKWMPLMSGQLVNISPHVMQPTGTILACVTDEDGNKVVADIQVEDGAYYKTSEGTGLFGGCVSLPAAGGKGRKIKVFPRSNEHYDGVFYYDIKEDGITTIPTGVLKLFRRKHRINIKVNGKQGNDVMPLAGATVSIKDMTVKTDSKGIATLTFESPGTSFLVKVKPAKGDNFSHWEGEMVIPVSKTALNKVVDLTPAKEILASVTELKDGKTGPSKGAKVYVKTLKNGWGNSSSNYAECITDANGNCSLKGIPVAENNVEVFVSKNPGDESKGNIGAGGVITPSNVTIPNQNGGINPNQVLPGTNSSADKGTYVGDMKEAYWFNGQFQSKVALKLDFKKEFNVKDVWGFPVHIEVVEAQTDGSFLLSGSLYNLPDNANFKSIDAQNRLDFKKEKFVKSAAGGVNTHQPAGDALQLQQKSFPVKIGNGLQGKASAATLAGNAPPGQFPKLYAKKGADGGGEIRTAVQLELSSFEGAYQLSGKVELGENGNPGSILIFKAGSIGKRKLNIGSSVTQTSMKNLKFMVHKFEAEADVSQSYVTGDSVRFFTVLHTNLKDVLPSDIALKAGYITVLPDKILPFEGGNDINFTLEKWKVTGQATTGNMVWKYDKNNGGIVIEKAVVNTGVISVNLKNLIVKPDRLIADNLDVSAQSANDFTLGGIVPLEITPGAQAFFSYDPKCYHDSKPHWKLSILSKTGNNVVARVSKLDGLDPADKLEFGAMNLFSDNKQELGGPSGKQITLFKVMKLDLNTIDVGKDFFTLVGKADMDIPKMSNGGGGMTGQIIYTKNAQGQVKANIKPLFFDVEGKGQVNFQADDNEKTQTIADGLFTAAGTMKIYDTPSGKSFVVKALLKHQKINNGFSTTVEVVEGKVPLESKFLQIKPGLELSSMKVVDGAWNNLRLTTVMPNDGNGFQNVKDEEKYRTMTLIVKGAIETDPSSGMVGVKGMETAVGTMTLYYDFNRQEVRGQFLFTPPTPVACGIVNITSGNVSMVVGTSGIYIMTNGTGDIAVAGLPIPLTGAVSFMTGYYTKPIYQEDIAILTSLAVQKTLPDEFASGIKGAYASMTISSELLDKGFEYDLVGIAMVSAKAFAGIAFEYRMFTNFKSLTSLDIMSGIYGFGGVSLSGEATILGIGATGGVNFNVQLSLVSQVSPVIGFNLASVKETIKSMSLSGCGSVGASFFIGVTTPIEDLGDDVSVDVSANFTISTKPKLEFALSSCNNGMPVKKL